MTHTPGPWIAVGQSVYAQTPQDVNGISFEKEEPHGYLISESTWHEPTCRLIASAPDLLAALEELVRDGYSEENEQRALAAIAKARGE